ncbi:MAG TPA: hypothetical protein PLS03_17550 [Terrimicrobiaceae bacterium]|nr:hypothetical protein [Terrimicrobiaceae bacterium]
MADQAKITSIEVLESFRSSLILFIHRAHTRIDEVGDEVRRTRSWLQSDRRIHWEGEIRRRRRILDQAEAELHSARMSALTGNHSLQVLAARRARASVEDAEKKLQNVRRWSRDFDGAAEPLVKRLEILRGELDHELPKALAFLVAAQSALEAYAASGPPPRTDPPNPSPL